MKDYPYTDRKLPADEDRCVGKVYVDFHIKTDVSRRCEYRALPGYAVCGIHLKKRMADHKKTHPDYEPVSISDIKEAYKAEMYSQKKQGKDEG